MSGDKKQLIAASKQFNVHKVRDHKLSFSEELKRNECAKLRKKCSLKFI